VDQEALELLVIWDPEKVIIIDAESYVFFFFFFKL